MFIYISMSEVRKIYLDSRYKTLDSNNDSDFFVELDRNIELSDQSKVYIDDIVLPISYNTVDFRNNKIYLNLTCGLLSTNYNCTIANKNYTGDTLATEMQIMINATILPFTNKPNVIIDYDLLQNTFKISFTDERDQTIKSNTPIILRFLSDQELKETLKLDPPNTVNTIIRNTNGIKILENTPYFCYIDLVQTRNIYLTSSTLANYDVLSNFGVSNIIKKIPIAVPINTLLVYSSGNAIDYITVSRRSINKIDFQLRDTKNRIIDLQNNHWSFSLNFIN
jgi:hypothetical protein